MFSKKITESDAFMSMPDSTQNLYFHLSMNADDDGFVDKPKAIMRMIGAKEDDIKVLITKAFLIPFESGIVVIKHWRINNILKNDRYKETTYTTEKALLDIKSNGAYTVNSGAIVNQLEPSWNQVGTIMEPQYSIGKNRLDKSSKDKSNSGEEVADTPIVNAVKPLSEKEKIMALLYDSSFSEKLKVKIVDWLDYKKYQYKATGFQSLLTIIAKNAGLYGEQAIIDLIDESMANTYKGIIFDKLKKPTFEKSKQAAKINYDEE